MNSKRNIRFSKIRGGAPPPPPDLNNNIPNRLDPGFFVNHTGSTIPGYEINSFISGFSFSGVIPKDHNVLSTNLNTLLS